MNVAKQALANQLDIFSQEAPALSEGNTTVAQSNILARHPMRLGLYASRLFVLMLRCVHKNDKILPEIKFPAKDVLMGGNLTGPQYKMLHAACDELMDVKLNLLVGQGPRGVNDYYKCQLVDNLQVDNANRTGMIKGSFSKTIEKHILDLQNHFTLGEVQELLMIRNPHTHRFYWLFLSWADPKTKRGERTFDLDELREVILGTTKEYGVYGKLNQNVIKPAIEELNKMGFKVTCEEKKQGKRVDKLSFVFHMAREVKEGEGTKVKAPKAAAPDENFQKWLASSSEKMQRAAAVLSERSLTDSQIAYFLPQIGDTDLSLKRLFAINHQALLLKSDKKIPNIAAYLCTEIKTQFKIK